MNIDAHLVKAIVYTLNYLPCQRTDHPQYQNTYALAAALDRCGQKTTVKQSPTTGSAVNPRESTNQKKEV